LDQPEVEGGGARSEGEKEKSLRVFCDQRFASDCLDQLEEWEEENRERWLTQRVLKNLEVVEREARSWSGRMGRRRSRMISAGRSERLGPTVVGGFLVSITADCSQDAKCTPQVREYVKPGRFLRFATIQ